jgi:hypothetical protein
VTSRQASPRGSPPGLLFRLLVAACGLDAGLVAPFHLFTRTRGYFENATPSDFVLIVVGVLVGIAILLLFKGRSFWVLAASAAAMAVVAFLTIVQYPSLEYASNTLPRVEFLGIESQPMALNYAAITCCAILLCGCTFDILSRPGAGDGTMLFPAALVFGAGIHFFAAILLPSTTGLMVSLAASATVLIALLGKGFDALQSWLDVMRPTIAVPLGRRVVLWITAVFSWLLAAGLEIMALLVFFGTLKQPGDLVNGSLLFCNVIAGAAIAALVAVVARKRGVLGSIAAVAGGGAGMVLLFYMASTGTLVTLPVIVLGIPLVLPAWHAVSELSSAGARGTTGVLLLVGWLAAAYLAFIPIKVPDLLDFSSWIYIAVVSVVVVEVGLSILRVFLVKGAHPDPTLQKPEQKPIS